MKEKLYITDTYYTLVKACLSINNNNIEGLFYIDTASSENIISCDYKKYFSKTENTEKSFDSVNSQTSLVVQKVRLSITIDDRKTEENFNIMDLGNLGFGTYSLPIFGILGINYLVNNKIILDYEKMELYNEDILCDTSKFKQKCPFRYGINNYGIAAIGIMNRKEDDVLVTLLDTGCNHNIICKKALEEFSFKVNYTDDKLYIHDINSTTLMQQAGIEFYLLIFKDNNMAPLHFSDRFYVNDTRDYLCRKEGCKQAEAIIGANFIINNKCILDFRTGDMFSSLWENDFQN